MTRREAAILLFTHHGNEIPWPSFDSKNGKEADRKDHWVK